MFLNGSKARDPEAFGGGLQVMTQIPSYNTDDEPSQRISAAVKFFTYMALSLSAVMFLDDFSILPPSTANNWTGLILSMSALLFGSQYVSAAIESLETTLGGTIVAVIMAFFGNLVECIVGAMALKKGLIVVVQTSLIGSMLSNMVLLIGVLYVLGDRNNRDAKILGPLSFSKNKVSKMMASVLLSTVCLIIPMTMASVEYVDQDTNSVNYIDRDNVVLFSRIISLLLLTWYLGGVILKAVNEFKGKSASKTAMTPHKALQALIEDNEDDDDDDEDDDGDDDPDYQTVYHVNKFLCCPGTLAGLNKEKKFKFIAESLEMERPGAESTTESLPSSDSGSASRQASTGGIAFIKNDEQSIELKKELKSASCFSAFMIALFHCLICGVLAEVLTGKIDLIFGNGGGEEFLGMIVLPIAGNFFEHFTAINNIIDAAKMPGHLSADNSLLKYKRWKKATSAMAKALESVSNIAMFVFPLMVIIGWASGQELTLDVGLLSTVVLASSVFMVAIVVSNDKINMNTGLLLILVYVVIAISYWFHSSQDYFVDITSINFANGTSITSN